MFAVEGKRTSSQLMYPSEKSFARFPRNPQGRSSDGTLQTFGKTRSRCSDSLDLKIAKFSHTRSFAVILSDTLPSEALVRGVKLVIS